MKERLARSGTFGKMVRHAPDWLLQLRKKPKINIEITNACNLKCPLCYTAHCMKRKKGFMTIEDFKWIINDLKGLKSYIALNFAGEPTLNKNWIQMVEYAHDNGFATLVSTNATQLHKYDFDDIVASGLTHIDLSIDGASQKTLEKYRVGANWEQVFRNMCDLIAAKDRILSQTPIIDWQFIVMTHNQHEILEAKLLANQIGVNRLVLRACEFNMGHGATFKTDVIEQPDEKYRKSYSHSPIQICPWIWDSVIYWNGDVGICCFDFEGSYAVGNVFKAKGGFRRLWGSYTYKKLRRSIVSKSIAICRVCKRMEEVEPIRYITVRPVPDVLPKSYS